MGKIILSCLVIGSIMTTFTSTPEENEERVQALEGLSNSIQTHLVEDKEPTPSETNQFEGLGPYEQMGEIATPDIVRMAAQVNLNNALYELGTYLED